MQHTTLFPRFQQFPALAAETAVSSPSLAAAAGLPRWDLSALYAGMDDPALTRGLAEAEKNAKAFAARYQGKLAGLSGAHLAQAIAENEAIDEALGKAGSYASLLFAANSSDAAISRFSQSINERLTDISGDLLFFTLEINRMDDAALDEKLNDPALAHWAPFLRDTRLPARISPLLTLRRYYLKNRFPVPRRGAGCWMKQLPPCP